MTARPQRWQRIIDQLPEAAYPLYGLGRSLMTLLVGRPHPIRGVRQVNPFFIIGSGRSGNTLLRRILQAHSALHIPPENHALGAAITVYRRYRSLPWPHLVDLALGTFQFSRGFEAFDLDLRPLADELHRAPRSERNLASLLDAFYRYHARVHGQRCLRWGDKTPLNTFNAFKIGAVFPEAQFIHMARDGVDVVESYVRAGLVQSHEEAAHRWSSAVEAARLAQRRYPKQFLETRYELLAREPERTVRGICDFLEVDYEPQMITETAHAKRMGDVALHSHHAQSLLPIHDGSIGKGRRELDRQTLAALARVMEPGLRDLGYEPAHR